MSERHTAQVIELSLAIGLLVKRLGGSEVEFDGAPFEKAFAFIHQRLDSDATELELSRDLVDRLQEIIRQLEGRLEGRT